MYFVFLRYNIFIDKPGEGYIFLRYNIFTGKPGESYTGMVPKFPQLPGYSKTIPGISPMFHHGQKGMLNNVI